MSNALGGSDKVVPFHRPTTSESTYSVISNRMQLGNDLGGERSAWVDNAKFVLIFFVVLGHSIEQLRYDAPYIEALYQFIYLFHMPAFVYLSGALSQPEFGTKQGARWLATLILPLITFQFIYLALEAYLLHKPFALRVSQPYWLLWYLACLACWRIMLISAISLKYPIILASVVAVLSGYSNDVGDVLSRTLVFFPFFLAGYRYGTSIRGSRPLAWVTLLAMLVFGWMIRHVNAQWLYGVTPYADFWGGPKQIGLLAISAAGVWALLRLIPRRVMPMTRFGRQSLSVYLLHGLIIKTVTVYGLWTLVRSLGPEASLALVSATALMLVFLLSAAAPLVRPIMDYRWIWIRWGSSPRAEI